MKNVMLKTSGCGNVVVSVWNEKAKESYTYIVACNLLRSCDKKIFIASIVDADDLSRMTESSTETEDDGYFVTCFEITRDGTIYTIFVSYNDGSDVTTIEVLEG